MERKVKLVAFGSSIEAQFDKMMKEEKLTKTI